MFTPEQIKALEAPLSQGNVKSRTQAGRQLSYIEGWKAIEEANRIFGFEAWDRETVELRQLGEPREVEGKWRIAYLARVRITVATPTTEVIRDGCGYGSGIDRDLGSAHESALKEAETDAMKRALMTFGNPFGLALYDKEQRNVDDGRAAEKPASPPVTLAGKDAEAVSDTLIVAVQRSATLDELGWVETEPSNVEAWERLPKLEQQRVARAINDQRKKLGAVSAVDLLRAG